MMNALLFLTLICSTFLTACIHTVVLRVSYIVVKLLSILLPYTAKLSQSCTKYMKTFAMHQAVAIMYCTQQVIQGETFRNWLKICENRKSFPT